MIDGRPVLSDNHLRALVADPGWFVTIPGGHRPLTVDAGSIGGDLDDLVPEGSGGSVTHGYAAVTTSGRLVQAVPVLGASTRLAGGDVDVELTPYEPGGGPPCIDTGHTCVPLADGEEIGVRSAYGRLEVTRFLPDGWQVRATAELDDAGQPVLDEQRLRRIVLSDGWFDR